MPDDQESLDKVADALTALVVIQRAAMEYHERVTEVLEKQTEQAKHMADMQRLLQDVSEQQQQLLQDVKSLHEWRNKKQAVTDAMMWLLDKAPTIGALLVVLFWALSQWDKKA